VDTRTAVILDGLSYRVVSAVVTPELPIPGGEVLRASGVFEVIKLRVTNLTPQTRLMGPAVLNLYLGGQLREAAAAITAALSGSHWRPLRLQVLGRHRSAVRKLFYDVPRAAAAHGTALRIGHLDIRRPFGVVALRPQLQRRGS